MLVPFVRQRVGKLYDTSGAGGTLSVCPGETNCQRFQSAAGKTHKIKEENACTGCELFDSKPKQVNFSLSEDAMEQIVSSVERIRAERNSTLIIDLSKISNLQWQLLINYENEIESEERNLKLHQKVLLEALLQKGI